MSAKHWHILPLGLIAGIIILSLACQGLARPTDVSPSEPAEAVESGNESQPTEEAPLGPVSAGVGEIVESGDLAMFVVGWEEIAPTSYWKPESGKKFIAVDFMVVNMGKIPVPLSCYSDVYLKDETAQVYDNDSGAQLAGRIHCISLEVNPGEKVRGKVGFQVPENATGLQFIFDSDDWNAGKVFVDLGVQPTSAQVPSSLPGEKPQTSDKVGEPIQFGSLIVTVNAVTHPTFADYNKPAEGNTFIAVDVTIENTGSVSVEIYPGGQMAILDSLHLFYTDDIEATIAAGGGSSMTISLAPGEKIRTQVGYQIPADATGLLFVFDNDHYEPGRVTIALP